MLVLFAQKQTAFLCAGSVLQRELWQPREKIAMDALQDLSRNSQFNGQRTAKVTGICHLHGHLDVGSRGKLEQGAGSVPQQQLSLGKDWE